MQVNQRMSERTNERMNVICNSELARKPMHHDMRIVTIRDSCTGWLCPSWHCDQTRDKSTMHSHSSPLWLDHFQHKRKNKEHKKHTTNFMHSPPPNTFACNESLKRFPNKLKSSSKSEHQTNKQKFFAYLLAFLSSCLSHLKRFKEFKWNDDDDLNALQTGTMADDGMMNINNGVLCRPRWSDLLFECDQIMVSPLVGWLAAMQSE